MNIQEMILEFLRNNPNKTSSEIADGAGLPRRIVRPLMTELYLNEKVARTVLKEHPFYYSLPSPEDYLALGEKYGQHRCRAEELESKQLWRRAAREWLSVMDSTRNEEAREKAAARREYCISRSDTGCHSETTGIRVHSAPGAEMWGDL